MRLTTRPEMKKRRPNGTMTAAAAIAMASANLFGFFFLFLFFDSDLWRENEGSLCKTRRDYNKSEILNKTLKLKLIDEIIYYRYFCNIYNKSGEIEVMKKTVFEL